MDLRSAVEWMRDSAHHVDALCAEGDHLALAVRRSYEALYRHQLDVILQGHFVAVVEDYIRRDMDGATRKVLEDRHGYKLGEHKPLRVFGPGARKPNGAA